MVSAIRDFWVDDVIHGTSKYMIRAVDLLACMVLSSLFAHASLQTRMPLSSMVWLAAMAANPVFSMAVQVCLCGAWEVGDVFVLAASIVAAIVFDRHADNMWLCRCISACCAAYLCPDDGLGKIVAIVCSFEKPTFGKKGNAPAGKSSAPQPVASATLDTPRSLTHVHSSRQVS